MWYDREEMSWVFPAVSVPDHFTVYIPCFFLTVKHNAY